MNAVQQAVPVYASSCAAYYHAGWPCIIPVPAEQKFPPPEGYTGASGRDTAPEDIARWAGPYADWSIALRMPDGIIGIDIDEYAKGAVTKHGAATVAAAEAELGPLPPTYSSTARGPGQPSRIAFYQVPPGRYAGQLGPDVEIIQRHHRYAVVAPSPHHGAGADYAWYAPDGSPLDGRVPSPGEMAVLPEAWMRHLAGGASPGGPGAASRDAGEALLSALSVSGYLPPCVGLGAARYAALTALQAAEAGSRHDAMTSRTYELVMLGAEGHPGSLAVLDELRELWDQLMAGEADRKPGKEFTDMVTGAARNAVTKNGGPDPVPYDPCLDVGGLIYQGEAPGGEAGQPQDRLAGASQAWSPFMAIGAQEFSPAATLDAPLADTVLHRAWPVLRYAPDAGSWVVRGPEHWDVRKGDLARWAVDLVSRLMPRGDPQAADGSEEKAQAVRRARFCTNASTAGIAGKMSAQVTAGHHPSTVELASLDAEQEILWAGGWPYDLRACGAGPAVAGSIHPGWPHLHSAGVVPELRPTPLWDAFTAAVWPDETVRAWSLRVLSVAVTGYSDKALPILLGETDRGKTEVIKLMMNVLGSYAHVADARLLSPADRSHASIVYALKGRRLSFIDEAPRAGSLAQERLKQITGGAELTGNRMGENPVTFVPTHTLILTANPEHEPKLTDAAVRRRVRLIPCNGDPAAVRAARAAIGLTGGPAWRAEAPGVLAKIMAEAAGWLADPGSADNDAAPDAGRAAAEEIVLSQDHVLAWVREECEPWAQGSRARELFMAFTESCRRLGIAPHDTPTETAWGRRLNTLGYPSRHTMHGNFRGLRIRPPQSFTPTLAEFTGASGGSAAGPAGGPARNERSTPHPTTGFQTPQQTPHAGNGAGHTIHSDTSMKGMKSNTEYIDTYAHTRAHTQGVNTYLSDLSNPSNPSATLVDAPAPAESPLVPESPSVIKAARPRKVKVPDPELTGPSFPLPAVVLRDGRVLPCTIAQAEALAMPASAAGHLTVDVETTGYPPGHEHYALRTVQAGGESMAAVFRASDPEQMAAVSRLVARATVLRAHSAAADLVPLDHAGLADPEAAWAKMHDTVLTAKLADPALSGSDADGLKDLARDLLRETACAPDADKRRAALFASAGWLKETSALTPPDRSGWAQVDPECEAMVRYAASDVLDTAAIARQLPPPPPAVYERERTAQRMCARVSHRGLALDGGRVRELIERETASRELARQTVTGTYGVENPGSAQQVAAAFAELGMMLPRTKPSSRFPQGQPSVAEAVLSGLRGVPGATGELATAILDYREHATILSLTLEPFGVLCERGDGRARPVVYTINADTGRMSCVRPNLQQIKREGGYRSCITADPGYLLVSADFASVEIRVAAGLSGDPALIDMIRNGDAYPERKQEFDLHWRVTRQVWGDQASKSHRYGIKRAVFGHMYGGAAEAMANGAGIPLEAAHAVKNSLAALAPGYTAWDKRMRQYVRDGGAVFGAYSGRPIWLDKRQPHKAANYAIQGTAREFLVDALLRWERTPWGGCVILPVHDELIAVVPAAEAGAATEALVACMKSELNGVSIVAEASEPSFAWQDAA
jgi:DNA polymerase I-like protein with 3'-5' exonuclease and polymerase domains